ncbi:MAG: outer membrane protein transport protein [Porticoccus sp.]|nr:outer membrane protein transport protein [Porticoccus sp.]
MHFNRRILQTSTFICSSVMMLSATASGFRLPELSTAGTSLSSAVVANPDLPGALPYNPAIMAFQKKGQLIGGVVFVQPDISANPDIGTASDSQGKDHIAVPNVFVTKHIDEKWSWGVGVNAPFGLETKWKDETFEVFDLASDAFEPEHSKLKMLNINPNAAYQLNANTSLAFGVDNYRVLKLIFNTQDINIDGSGDGFGWNLGLLHVQNDWSFGLSYRSSVKVTIDGTLDPSALGPIPASDAKAKIDFPSLLQIGGRYKVDERLAVELDIEKTGWSSFDTVEISHSSSGIQNPVNSESNWKNAIAYRLGATYEISSANQLLAGYAYDKSPSNDDFFSARLPGNDRQTLSVGLAHKLANWNLEFAYMYVKADDRKIAATNPETIPYNGTYQLSAHLFGFGVNTQF